MCGSQWRSLAAARSLYKAVFFLQITQESVLVLQVTRESGSGTTSHVRTSERAMKPKVHTINHYHHSTKQYRQKYHKFVAVGIDTRAVDMQ